MSVYLAYANANLGRYEAFILWEKDAESLLGNRIMERSTLAEISFAVKVCQGEFGLAYDGFVPFYNSDRYSYLAIEKKEVWELFSNYLRLVCDTGVWDAHDLESLSKSNLSQSSGYAILKKNKASTNVSLIVFSFAKNC